MHIYDYGAIYSGEIIEFYGILTYSLNEYGAATRIYTTFMNDGSSQTIKTYKFTRDGEYSDGYLSVDEYTVGGSGNSPIYTVFSYLYGDNSDLMYVNIPELSNAIEAHKEIVILVNDGGAYEKRYFRAVSTQGTSQQYISYYGDSYWIPELVCTTVDGKHYYARYDHTEHGEDYFKIFEDYPRYTPLSLDLSNNAINFNYSD